MRGKIKPSKHLPSTPPSVPALLFPSSTGNWERGLCSVHNTFVSPAVASLAPRWSPSHVRQFSISFYVSASHGHQCSPDCSGRDHLPTGCSPSVSQGPSLYVPFTGSQPPFEHPPAPGWGSSMGGRWISASPWASKGCRGSAVSPWSASQAAGKSALAPGTPSPLLVH